MLCSCGCNQPHHDRDHGNRDTKRVVDIKYTPSVIEPSFGVGRVLTGIFEHSYSCRGNDKSRGVLSFTPAVAPCKCSVFPLTTKIDGDLVHGVFRSLIDLGVSAIVSHLRWPCGLAIAANLLLPQVDKSQASIGKRYARTDEIGIPFAITVDDATSTDKQVTVRERDTAAQIRVPIAEVPQLVRRVATPHAACCVAWLFTKPHPVATTDRCVG